MYGRTRTGRLIHITNDDWPLCGVKAIFVDTRPKIELAWNVAWSDPWHPRHVCIDCRRLHIAQQEDTT